MTPLPYWKLPLADVVVPRQAAFKRNMALINASPPPETVRCPQGSHPPQPCHNAFPSTSS